VEGNGRGGKTRGYKKGKVDKVGEGRWRGKRGGMGQGIGGECLLHCFGGDNMSMVSVRLSECPLCLFVRLSLRWSLTLSG